MIYVRGTGPAAYTLALCLQQADFEIVLAPASEHTVPVRESARTLFLNLNALHLLRTLLPMLSDWGTPVEAISVWDALGFAAGTFRASECHVPQLGTVISWSKLTRALADQVAEKAIPTQPGPYTPRDADSLLVIAEGTASATRSEYGFKTWDWPHHQIVSTAYFESDEPPTGTAYQAFLSGGTVAFLPFQKGYSVVTTEPSASASTDTAWIQNVETLARESERLGILSLHSPIERHPLRGLLAKQWVQDRILLLGDAACSIHPLAGQGFNLAVHQIQCLLDVLSTGRQASFDWKHPTWLKRYEQTAQRKALSTTLVMESFKRVFTSAKLDGWRTLSNAGWACFVQQPFLKRWAMRWAMGL